MRKGKGYGAATAGAAIGVVAGSVFTFLVALAFRPASHNGWEDLGWSVYTLVACAVVAVVLGTVGIFLALRRVGDEGAALTAGIFVVAAPLLIVGGPLVIVAPVAARWMALGFVAGRGRADGDNSDTAIRTVRAFDVDRAVPQRLVLWAVVSAIGVVALTNMLGYDHGGRVGGTAIVWAAASAVPVVYAYILRRAVPLPVIVALVAVMIGAGGFAAQRSTREAHPTGARLAEMGRELLVPKGQRVVRRISASAAPYPADRFALRGLSPQPVAMIQSISGGPTPPMPAALTPGAGGLLPGVALVRHPGSAASGQAAAANWADSLRDEGWRESQTDPRAGTVRLCRLPPPADDFVAVNGYQVLERGPWQRAAVIPFESGAIVLLCTRP